MERLHGDIRDFKIYDFELNEKGDINVYNTYDEAMLICGMHEFEDVLVMEIKCNYVD